MTLRRTGPRWRSAAARVGTVLVLALLAAGCGAGGGGGSSDGRAGAAARDRGAVAGDVATLPVLWARRVLAAAAVPTLRDALAGVAP